MDKFNLFSFHESFLVYYFPPYKILHLYDKQWSSWSISWPLKKVVYIPKTDDDILPELSNSSL